MRTIGLLNPSWPPVEVFATKRALIFGYSHLRSNQYLLLCRRTKESVIIDFCDPNPARWPRFAESQHVNLKKILQTHVDSDAGRGLFDLLKLPSFANIPVLCHQSEPLGKINESIKAELNDGDVIPVGELKLTVIHAPGHKEDAHVLFHEADEGVCFTGDILFRGSGSSPVLENGVKQVQSLKRLVNQVPEYTLLFPNHFGLTSLGAERLENPNLMGIEGPSYNEGKKSASSAENSDSTTDGIVEEKKRKKRSYWIS